MMDAGRPTPLRAIRLLADGACHSGEAIAAHLGLSRAAVWKALRKACTDLGLEILAVRGHGYRLSAPLELLDAGRILAALSPVDQGRITRLEIHDQIDSTNSHLMREAAVGAPSGTLCLAERQSAGRGRMGRTWVSPFGNNLYLSLLWRYPFGLAGMTGLSLAAGAAVADALRGAGATDIALKWPNDILWRRRKLAGLLLEVAGEAQGPAHVVVGVGINTHLNPRDAAAIDRPWIDLDQVLGAGTYSRNVLAATVADALGWALERYAREGLAPFLADWERYDLYRGEQVEIRWGADVVRGIHLGLDAHGALRLDTDQGIQTFHAGEVSLRMEGD
jgi:BirA family transcriptional regulator, biotin operon repressor / biotin---[acetyl-CoA-carboxylase] ligase